MFSKDQSILDYEMCDEDTKSFNPYLKKLKDIINKNISSDKSELASLILTRRNDFVSEYSFTIPYYDILKKIAEYSPIVEIGAGSGYLARCLSELGVDVIAYDSFPPGEHSPWEWFEGNSWFDDSWFHIVKGDESAAAHHPDRTLLMAWPMPLNRMAYNALSYYKNAGGRTVIFIGDPHPGSSGDEYFYQLLHQHEEIENIDLYCWPGIKEKLLIYSLAGK